jgi:hypothetical protein
MENLSQQAAIAGADVAAGDLLYVFDISASGKARSKKITTAEARRMLGDGYNAQTWAAGNLAITPGSYVQRHLEILTVTLSAGAATLTATDGTASTRFSGNRLDLLILLPGTAGVVITIVNSTGDTLAIVEDDGSGEDAFVELYHNGTKWKAIRKTLPTGV